MGAVYARVGIAGEDMPRIIMPSLLAQQVKVDGDGEPLGLPMIDTANIDAAVPLVKLAINGSALEACLPWEFSNVVAIEQPLRHSVDKGMLHDPEGLQTLMEAALSKVCEESRVVACRLACAWM